eukprot:3121467-Amphidinium_carterae.1
MIGCMKQSHYVNLFYLKLTRSSSMNRKEGRKLTKRSSGKKATDQQVIRKETDQQVIRKETDQAVIRKL